MIYQKNNGDVAMKKDMEWLLSENAKLKANADYLSMMTGVEIPVEEEMHEQIH